MDQRFVTLCVRAIIHPCILRKDKIFGVKTLRFFTQGIFSVFSLKKYFIILCFTVFQFILKLSILLPCTKTLGKYIL